MVKNNGFGGHFGTANCTPKSSFVDFAQMSPNFGYFDRNAMLNDVLATHSAEVEEPEEPEEAEEQPKPKRKFWNFHA